MGCIDMNAWYSRADKPERPDFALFDLDPTPEVGFAGAVEAALLVRVALDAVGLRGYPKTSGADGVHVLVPLARRYTYEDTRKLSATLAKALAASHPELITTEWSKARRRGVLIDANQNGPGRTIASVYSVRPAPGCARVDAGRVGRAHAGARAGALHDGRGARPDRRPRRPLRAGARRPPGPRAGASKPLTAATTRRRLGPGTASSRRRSRAGCRRGRGSRTTARPRAASRRA